MSKITQIADEADLKAFTRPDLESKRCRKTKGKKSSASYGKQERRHQWESRLDNHTDCGRGITEGLHAPRSGEQETPRHEETRIYERISTSYWRASKTPPTGSNIRQYQQLRRLQTRRSVQPPSRRSRRSRGRGQAVQRH